MVKARAYGRVVLVSPTLHLIRECFLRVLRVYRQPAWSMAIQEDHVHIDIAAAGKPPSGG